MAIENQEQLPEVGAAKADVDGLLKAWFEALAAQPVPEALLRHLDGLDEAQTA